MRNEAKDTENNSLIDSLRDESVIDSKMIYLCQKPDISSVSEEQMLSDNLSYFLELFCLLHLNDLLLRKVMVYLDGSTSGPTSFYGPIVKRL